MRQRQMRKCREHQGVFYCTGAQHVQHIGHGQRRHGEYFAVVGTCGASWRSVECQVAMQRIVLQRWIRRTAAQWQPLSCHKSGFFFELSSCGDVGRFAWIDHAAGNFEADRIGAWTILPQCDDVAVGGNRDNVDPVAALQRRKTLGRASAWMLTIDKLGAKHAVFGPRRALLDGPTQIIVGCGIGGGSWRHG